MRDIMCFAYGFIVGLLLGAVFWSAGFRPYEILKCRENPQWCAIEKSRLHDALQEKK